MSAAAKSKPDPCGSLPAAWCFSTVTNCVTGSLRSGTGEKRVSLTFEYLTDVRMRFGRRLISNMKDAVAYFGFRQVFRGATAREGRGRAERSPP